MQTPGVAHILGNVLGAIAGDIAGSRFEGLPGPSRNFELFHADCRYTDDTVCTVAIAAAMLADGPEADFATALRTFCRTHPNAGYGGMFQQWVFADDAGAYGSWGNGAPMRVSAVGWLAESEDAVREIAAAQARVSHDHQDAVNAAVAVAHIIWLGRHGASAQELEAVATEKYGYDLNPDRVFAGGGFDVSAAGTVPPALAAAFRSNSWEDAVRTSICLGGDADTLAAIAGAVAEVIHGVPASVAAKACGYLTSDLLTVLTDFLRATAE